MKKKLLACAAAVAPFAVFAEDAAVSLPSTGVDVGGYITAAILGLGAIVGVAVGGYFAFLLIKKGIRWARTAM